MLPLLYRFTSGFRRLALFRTLLGVLRVGVILIFIWLSKTAIDCATGRASLHGDTPLAVWFALMVICMLADVALSQWGKYIETRATMRMNNSLNRRLFNVLMALPLVNGKQGFHSGDMLNRLTLDVRTVSTFALTQLPALIVMVVQLLGAFIFLAWLNPYLALAPVIIMPLCILSGKLYFRRQRRLSAEIREGESDMHVSIQESLQHRILLRSLECVDEMDHRLLSIQQKLETSNREQTKLSTISSTLVRLGFILGYLTAFGWSIFSLEAGIITFGTMTAFIQLVNRIQAPIAAMAGYLPIFIATSVALDRLREIDEAVPLDNDSKEETDCEPLRSAGVLAKDLTFRYEADSKDIITSFTHDFRPGTRTMIVGTTGAGKTTLIKLLLGLLRPVSGEIEVYGDGKRRKVSASTLCNFVYVPQGNSLLHGTIRDNLLLADTGATEEKLRDVLHIAAADFVFELPQGLDTPCDETGGGISEGQAQRIAIARALLRPGSILVLDEFNSALDVDTAALLMQRLTESRPNATVIIIAHHRSVLLPYITDTLQI